MTAKKARRRAALVLGVIMLLLIVANLLLWARVLRVIEVEASKPGLLTVAVLSIGQGDAIYIESPTGRQVLIDGGPDGSVLRELPKVMPAFDRSLDVVVATHPDADHVAGLTGVVNRYEVGMFLEPGMYKDTTISSAVENAVDTRQVPRYLLHAGMSLDLGGGAWLEVLHPGRDVSRLSGQFANQAGLVMRLTYASTSAMFMADVPTAVEVALVATYGTHLDSDLLKAGHHGSRTSSSDTFVKAVSPDVALLSLGRGNSYHHPHVEPLSIFKKYGALVARTDLEGTLVFTSDGHEFVRKK